MLVKPKLSDQPETGMIYRWSIQNTKLRNGRIYIYICRAGAGFQPVRDAAIIIRATRFKIKIAFYYF